MIIDWKKKPHPGIAGWGDELLLLAI